MNWNYELISDISVTIEASETALIKINGICNSCILSSVIEAGATYTIQSSLASSELVSSATLISELNLENIKIAGVEYAELSFAIPSVYFKSPNFLYITNTSATESVRIDIRGNR
jgi:hypothetical protein